MFWWMSPFRARESCFVFNVTTAITDVAACKLAIRKRPNRDFDASHCSRLCNLAIVRKLSSASMEVQSLGYVAKCSRYTLGLSDATVLGRPVL